MEDIAGRYYIYNGSLKDSQVEQLPEPADNKAVYEVIRIIERVPLFLQDHYSRMESSLKAAGEKPGFSVQDLARMLGRLAEANDIKNFNAKITYSVSPSGSDLLLFVNSSYYPEEEVYEKGVNVGLLQLERKNPNVKLLNLSYKETAAAKIREGNYFEVLLCNGDGNITEGSKSNVFFVKGGKIYTTPGAHVLKGITRQYVADACKAAGYEVVEAFTAVDSLGEVEGLFLSGTSIKVLPIARVEGRDFPSAGHPVIKAVRMGYDEIIKKYIEQNVSIW